MTLDLVNCLVIKQYACLGGSMKVGKEYPVQEGSMCDRGPGQLLYSVVKQYACLAGSMMVGKEYSVLEDR